MSLKGKYALITGSSRGIGRGIALKLAEQGVKVAINYCRNQVAANDALAKIRGLGSDGFIVQGDVCRPDDIGRMFSRAKQEFGALDIFVANARPEVPTFYQPPTTHGDHPGKSADSRGLAGQSIPSWRPRSKCAFS